MNNKLENVKKAMSVELEKLHQVYVIYNKFLIV